MMAFSCLRLSISAENLPPFHRFYLDRSDHSNSTYSEKRPSTVRFVDNRHAVLRLSQSSTNSVASVHAIKMISRFHWFVDDGASDLRTRTTWSRELHLSGSLAGLLLRPQDRFTFSLYRGAVTSQSALLRSSEDSAFLVILLSRSLKTTTLIIISTYMYGLDTTASLITINIACAGRGRFLHSLLSTIA